MTSTLGRLRCAAVLFAAAVAGAGCGPDGERRSLEVTATAYTLRPQETQDYAPGVAAWGDKLEPGMKAIAVSRDLIPMGLRHETEVVIEGLSGTYIVRDKMNRRWERKIDIFMGTDVERAREWGRREVTIHWHVDSNEDG